MIEMLQVLEGVEQLTVGCDGGIFAGDGLCADIVMSDKTTLRFENVGYQSFGGPAVNVYLAEAAGLVPRVASCSTIGPPNIHRSGVFGHHFSPTIVDVTRAVSRHRELLEEVHYWPQCPQFWEVQDKSGVDYRYCARKKDAADEPPKPASCK